MAVPQAVIDEAVRVGPQKPDEAGELVKDVGVHYHAKQVIQNVASQHPQELITIQQRRADPYRTRYVDLDEAGTLLDDAFDLGEVRVLSARVRGLDTEAAPQQVVVLFETE